MDHRREVDGLRALAVIPVILFHAGYHALSGGFIGVDVFFVISGYLITSIILHEKQAGTFTLVNFWERRARRILPALFLVMAVCLPLAWLWLLPQDMASFSQSLAAVSVYVSNVLFWRTSGYFETAAELKPLLHTWSLAVEEQYYLFFPLFLMFSWKLGKRWILAMLAIVSIGSLGLAHWGSVVKPGATFYLLPTRAWELLSGALAAFYLLGDSTWRPSKVVAEAGGIMGFALILYAIFVFDDQTPFPSLYALVPTAGTVLIILFSSQHTVVGKLLGSRVLVGIGLISYSAYLWHQPLFAFARHRSIDEPSGVLLSTLSVLSLILAYFTWKHVESPFRNKQRFNRKQIFSYGATASLIFLIIGLFGHLTNGTFYRSYDPNVGLIETAKRDNGKIGRCWGLMGREETLSDACIIGTEDSGASFALIGDSHAGAIAAELGAAASERNLTGYDFSYNNCPPLNGGSSKYQESSQIACNRIREDLFDRASNQNLPRTLILLARWTIKIEQERFDNKEGGVERGKKDIWNAPDSDKLQYVDALRKSYIDSVRLMLQAGYKVVLVYPVPEMGWDVPTRLGRIYSLRNSISGADASTSYRVFSERNRRAYEALDAIGEHPNLARVKPEEILCNTLVPGRCAAHMQGVPLYSDDDHLSNAGAKLVAREIIRHIEPFEPTIRQVSTD